MGEVDKFSASELERLKIINGTMGNVRILNTFRELRTQLLKKNDKKNFVCMVSSITHGGGASYVAKNLAAVFALDKAKTSMLIDANLRIGTIRENFGWEYCILAFAFLAATALLPLQLMKTGEHLKQLEEMEALDRNAINSL